MVVTEAYLPSLLAQITSQGGIPPTYPERGCGVDLNVPTHSVSGSSHPTAGRTRRGTLEPRNLFHQGAELMGVRKDKQDPPRRFVHERIDPVQPTADLRARLNKKRRDRDEEANSRTINEVLEPPRIQRTA